MIGFGYFSGQVLRSRDREGGDLGLDLLLVLRGHLAHGDHSLARSRETGRRGKNPSPKDLLACMGDDVVNG